MSFVHRLDPGDLSSPAARIDDEPLPIASPPEHALEPCPHCGVQNGITALACWSCEAELSMVRPLTSDAEAGPAVVGPDSPAQSPANDGEPTHDLPLRSRDSHPASVSAFGDRSLQTALPDFRALAHTGADAEADSQYPLLTQVVDNRDLVTAVPAPAAVADRRKRQVVAAAIVLSALLGAAAYLYLPKSRTSLDVPLSRDTAVGAGGVAGKPALVAPNPGPTQSSQAEGSRSALTDAIDAATRALAVTPSAATDVKAGPLAASPANNPVNVVARPKATPPANTVASTDAQRGRGRGTKQSVSAAAAVPMPDKVEPARQTSAQFGPCTATVAALGLCSAPPIQSKE